jgi:hypothetical protein
MEAGESKFDAPVPLCKISPEQHAWEKLNSVASKLRRLNLAPHAKTISTAAGQELPFTASQPPRRGPPPADGTTRPDRRAILPFGRAIPPDRQAAQRPGRINLSVGGITLPSRFSRQKHLFFVQLKNSNTTYYSKAMLHPQTTGSLRPMPRHRRNNNGWISWNSGG